MTALFAPAVEGHGLRLVCVRIFGENGTPTVQVMAEDVKTRKLGVEDCAKMSRELAALLDVEDLMKNAYRLEVSSPGIDRPLVSLQDFSDFIGFEAKVELDRPHDGRKRFKGIVTGVEDERIKMNTEDGDVALPYSAVAKAKLLLTDELLKATQPSKGT